ncbi:MAG TPA: DUF4874 domain-containing protein [Oscillospiraceae bacterium]|nr:DUF4874 domain-containing protein [Oscillospiraceae bacterium]
MALVLVLLNFAVSDLAFRIKQGYEPEQYNIELYPPGRDRFCKKIEDNLNLSGKDKSLLNNPDRGFRGEAYITLGSGTSYGGRGDGFENLTQAAENFRPEGAKLMQTYVYLSEYFDRPLDTAALNQLKDYFEAVNGLGLRALLRFAYEYDTAKPMGPTNETIELHCSQLKGFFEENKELFNKTVYAAQLGMIGLWGEGHTASQPLDFGRVIAAVADMFPDKVAVMVRYPGFYAFIPGGQDRRFTVHDDFLVGIDHPWGMIPSYHPQYKMLLNKNLYNLSDGEMPWGSDQTVTEIDYRLLLGQVKGYSLTSMSIAHNYREGADYWLKRWQSQPLFEKDLKKMKLPYNPAMLEGGQISVFEYLQYHLGYQLGVSNLKVRKGKLSLLINNFGLDAPHEFELYYVVDGREIPAPGYDPMELSRFGQFAVEYDLNGAASFGLLFRHRRWGDLTIKLANDLPYENGVNIIIG